MSGLATLALEDEVQLEVTLFELLWKSGARVNIPDTLTYKYGKLESWYFNAKSAKRNEVPLVKRRRDNKVKSGDVIGRLVEAFCAGKDDDDVVGVWVNAEPGERCIVLHLTKRNFASFLRDAPRRGHGVLQKWVAPFGGRNCHLRADWSPHSFNIELRTNWHLVSGPTTVARPPIAERLATFEGGVRDVSSATVVNKHVHHYVVQTCEHIAEVLDEHHERRTKVQQNPAFPPQRPLHAQGYSTATVRS